VDSDTLVAGFRKEAWALGAEHELVLGRYRLLEQLGAGGFGVVWRARDETLAREVALKRISLPGDGESERPTREALATARLAHPSIVALYEACTDRDAFYLISELVAGSTLAELMVQGQLTDKQAIEIGVDLADALGHAHARGVIHRDVKPQNVIVPLSGDPAAKLADFGGARLSGEAPLTRTGDVLGTLAYMAPEQCDGNEPDERVDLYSLALVLYEALSGVNPVRGPTPGATARRIGRPLPELRRHRGDLPRELTQAIDTALNVQPRRRGTLGQLQESLEQALHQECEAPSRWRPRVSAPAPGRPGRSFPRTLWLGCLGAAIAWQALSGRAGLAVLMLAAALPLIALPRRCGPGWLVATLAPVLGLAGLAGVFPAIAGQARAWRLRAALGALGYWWLTLAEPLASRRLWLGPPTGLDPRPTWEVSPSSAVRTIGALLTLGVALGAGLWALGSAALPWIVRGRHATLDLLGAGVWSAAMLAAASALDQGPPFAVARALPRGAVLAAILAALLAVAARALQGPVRRRGGARD
jgi:eukaryotic-like serine/threonine-protein kinase